MKGWRAIRQLIDDGLAECARILTPGGYLLVKCMDYVESGHKVWNTFHVAAEAERLGLRLVDRFHHLTGGGPQVTANLDGSPREQQHATGGDLDVAGVHEMTMLWVLAYDPDDGGTLMCGPCLGYYMASLDTPEKRIAPDYGPHDRPYVGPCQRVIQAGHRNGCCIWCGHPVFVGTEGVDFNAPIKWSTNSALMPAIRVPEVRNELAPMSARLTSGHHQNIGVPHEC